MADLKVAGGGLPAPRASAPSPPVRAAQRAFFEAALTRTAGPTAPVSAAAPVAREDPRAARGAPPPAPDRLLRPGSFLDIKV